MPTIRDQIQKRTRKASLYCSIIPVSGTAGLVHLPLGRMLIGSGGLVLMSLAILTALMWRTRCPICKTALGAKARAITREHPTIDHCPHCGVNFDDPMPAT